MIDEYASEACRYVAGNQEGGVMESFAPDNADTSSDIMAL